MRRILICRVGMLGLSRRRVIRCWGMTRRIRWGCRGLSVLPLASCRLLSYVVYMADTATPAPTTLYAVVIDGHTAAETLAGWALPQRYTHRSDAIAACDAQNRAAALVTGQPGSWHVEHLA